MKEKDNHIALLLKRIPEQPGVYQYFDKEGQIIYVGKAKNLHRRVNSYFNKEHPSSKTRQLVAHIADIRYVVVESEQDAVVLSELFPESIWMAYATIEHLQIDLFAPLEGRNVILYPCTDLNMSNYVFFCDLAAAVHKQYPSIHITVDPILEDNATDEQKSRCIDLVEFLLTANN